MKKKKTTYPGGVPITPKLRYMQKNNYFEFVKAYQILLLQINKEGL